MSNMRVTISKGSPLRELADPSPSEYISGDDKVVSTSLTMRDMGELVDDGFLETDNSVKYKLSDSKVYEYSVNNEELLKDIRFVVSMKALKLELKDQSIPDMKGSVFGVYPKSVQKEFDEVYSILVSQ